MNSLLLLTFSLVAVAGGPAASQGASQSPDFSNVDDILSGRRLILPVEDLVVASGATSHDTILQTNDSTVTQQIPFDPGGTPLALASGRVFDLEDDVVVTMVATGGNTSINLRDAVGQRSLTVDTKAPICAAAQQTSCSSNLLVTGDLTGDGYDEIVLAYAGGGLQVATAVDVSDFEKGLEFGPLFEGSPAVQPQAMTVADFIGKGRGALAVADLPDLEVYQLDTTDNASATGLTLIRIATAPFDTPPSGVTSAQLSAGQFDDDAKDLELILMLAADNLLSGYFIQMSDASMPTIGDLQSLDIPADIIGQESGRLDWFGDRDQLVVTADWSGRSLAFLFVLAPINGDLASAVAGGTQAGFAGCTDGKQSRIYDVALGDFDFDLEDPASTPPDLEIGILAACEGDGVQQLQWQIFKVDPRSNGTFPTKLVASGTLQERSLPTTPVVSALVASDTQGRSLLLGPPTKVVINDHSQPRIVMGAPPMHIDFIQHPTDPGQPPTSFGKINMTTFPATDDNTDRGMNGEFDLATSSTVQNSSTQTTSYSYATGDAADANVGLGIPDVFSLGASIKWAAETTYAGFVQNQVGGYDSSSYSLQTITGFGDVIWFNTKRFNIWVYRVLGHFACPSDDPKCDSSLPLNLVFSGPDKIINQPHTPASQVEWYQPHHEVGAHPVLSSELGPTRVVAWPEFGSAAIP